MPATYDVTTDLGRVRLLITDTNTSAAIFSDDEINAFLALSPNVHRAAAEALDTIATSQALTLKVITLLDLTTNGAMLSTELRARAAQLRALADNYDDGGVFDWAEMVTNPPTWRERIWDQALRADI